MPKNSIRKPDQYALSTGTYDERRFLRGERPGEYKKGDYVTGLHEVGAPPDDVAAEMNELLDDIRNVENKDVLTAAAFFHAKFENIQPFADGNGRVGRLLMNYFLVCHDHPVITIHEEDRREYMSALEAWDVSQNLKPLSAFLKEQTVKSWSRLIGTSVNAVPASKRIGVAEGKSGVPDDLDAGSEDIAAILTGGDLFSAVRYV